MSTRAQIMSTHHSEKKEEKQHIKRIKRKIKKEEDETYVPTSDSSDSESEEGNPNYILSGGFREDRLIDSSSSFEEVAFSCKQKLLLEEQMRMLQVSSLSSNRTLTKEKSCFGSVNLSDALTIIKHFDNRKPMSSELGSESLEVKRTLCESKVFMYPDLCPEKLFSMFDYSGKLKSRKSKPEMIEFNKAEDNLIVLGLETFGFNTSNIRRHYLPWRSQWQIKERIHKCVGSYSKKNIIKHFKKYGEVPEFHIQLKSFDEKNIKAPIDQDLNNLPKWMEPYVDMFERDGPYPYFLETERGVIVKDNFETTPKSLCNNIITKREPIHIMSAKRKYKPENICEGIDLRQEFCCPLFVNSSFNDILSNDLELDISMNGSIKLSTLKRSKPYYVPNDAKKQCKRSDCLGSDLNFPSSVARERELNVNHEHLCTKSDVLTICSQDVKNSSIPVSSKMYFENQVPSIIADSSECFSSANIKEKTNFEVVSVKLENEGDAF